jgi:hypothetical protein
LHATDDPEEFLGLQLTIALPASQMEPFELAMGAETARL